MRYPLIKDKVLFFIDESGNRHRITPRNDCNPDTYQTVSKCYDTVTGKEVKLVYDDEWLVETEDIYT